VNVFIADQDLSGAEAFAEEVNKNTGKEQGKIAATKLNVASWDEQVRAFDEAIKAFGRIDYVYPIAGIGERSWIKRDSGTTAWQKPDLTVRALYPQSVFTRQIPPSREVV
jgi:NAD(P)-dependent dehydrogenase (short-subunit alcohol dehydrogenase family)